MSLVATGTTSAGLRTPNTCADWTNPNGMMQIGSATDAWPSWTEWFSVPCAQSRQLYCFGVDSSAPLSITPAIGRLAFVTNGFWRSGGGRASADAFCQMEADIANRSGTFKALMATSTESAASRFDLAGPPWVRADGIPIAAQGSSPWDGVQTGINVTLAGTYTAGFAAVGALSPNDTAILSRNCDDWTASNSSRFNAGVAESASEWFGETNGSTQDLCTNQVRLYCFEQ
jgi:hypothetical protein